MDVGLPLDRFERQCQTGNRTKRVTGQGGYRRGLAGIARSGDGPLMLRGRQT